MTPAQRKFLAAIPASWQQPLKEFCCRPEIDSLVTFLQEREASGVTIYPQKHHIFAALKATPFNEVKVVIVGQDPYHGPQQAHGLSFSVLPGVVQPPSLRNIFKEIHADLGIPIPRTGTLTPWTSQGVLLLNALLTVEAHSPASHAGKGWELFTDAIIEALIKREKPTVFMLWGAYAQKKVLSLKHLLDPSIQLVLKAAHPSPFSVTGFLGCRHFSKANSFLKQHSIPEIDWSLE